MKYTDLNYYVFYKYKIEKYDYINGSWFFKYGFWSFKIASKVFDSLNDTGVYRLIKCYDIKGVD